MFLVTGWPVTKDKGEKAWLLVKKRDAYSTYKSSSSLNNDSVKSGRTIEQVAAQAQKKGDVWLPKKGKVTKIKPSAVKAKQTLPRKVKPMIATQGRGASQNLDSRAPGRWTASHR